MSVQLRPNYFFHVEYIYLALNLNSAWVNNNVVQKLTDFTNMLNSGSNFLDDLKPPLIHLDHKRLAPLDPSDPTGFDLFSPVTPGVTPPVEGQPVAAPAGTVTVADPPPADIYDTFDALTSERWVFWGTGILEDNGVGDRDQVKGLLRRIFYPSQGTPRYAERIRSPFRWIAWYIIPDNTIGARFVLLDNGGVGGDK
jgi:hypothetical protein